MKLLNAIKNYIIAYLRFSYKDAMTPSCINNQAMVKSNMDKEIMQLIKVLYKYQSHFCKLKLYQCEWKCEDEFCILLYKPQTYDLYSY